MFRLILVSCLVSLAIGQSIYRPNIDWDSRIVGGDNAVSGQFPYQVSLRQYDSHFCGGIILNQRWILTAAHCTVGLVPSNIIVIVGSILLNSGGIAHSVSAIVNHPNFNLELVRNDVCVIKTATTIIFTTYVKSIALGSTFIGGGVSATASGWGRTSYPGSIPNNLQFIELSTITNDNCRDLQEGNGYLIYNSTLCTFTQVNQGICMGDSGGPLCAGEQVIGIASWGIPCAKGYPDVWTRVSYFRAWILTTMLLTI